MNSPFNISSFRIGDRVQMHPATDWWMRGVKFGEVVNLGETCLVIKLDLRPRRITVHPDKIGETLPNRD